MECLTFGTKIYFKILTVLKDILKPTYSRKLLALNDFDFLFIYSSFNVAFYYCKLGSTLEYVIV